MNNEELIQAKWEYLRSIVWPHDTMNGLAAHHHAAEFFDCQRSIAIIERKLKAQLFLLFELPQAEPYLKDETCSWKAKVQYSEGIRISFHEKKPDVPSMWHWQLGSLHAKHIFHCEGCVEGRPLVWNFSDLRTDIKYLLMAQKLG